jgi:hypothetical protein
LTTNTPFYNATLALTMFAGRYLVIVPVLAIAGSLAAKSTVPRSAGTLPTDGMQFALLLAGTIVIVGGLSFFPALVLRAGRRALRDEGGGNLLTGRCYAQQCAYSSIPHSASRSALAAH